MKKITLIIFLFAFSATVVTEAQVLCPAPTNVSVTNITTVSALVSWSAAPGAISYNVRHRAVGNPNWTTTPSASTSLLLSGLAPQTTYEVQVQSVCTPSSNTTALSSFSASITFATTGSNLTCIAPSNLAVANVTATSALATWSAVAGAVSYNVRYKPVASATWTLTNTTATFRFLSPLVPSTAYEVQVQTVCINSSNTTGLSPFTGSVYFTTMGPVTNACSAPTGLTASNITGTSATMSWNSSGAPFYTVRYRPSATLAWSYANSATTSVGLSGLSLATQYEAQVRGICGFPASNTFFTASPYSPSVFFMTAPQIIIQQHNLNTLRIELASAGSSFANVRIFDLKGMLLATETFSSGGTAEMNIAGFASGLYLAEVEMQGTTARQKFIVVR
jgi:hypothetical protein